MKRTLMLSLALFFAACGKTGGYPADTVGTRDGGKLKITSFVHASLLFEYDGKLVYVDPVSAHADYASLPDADVILVTHEHGDHFDVTAIRELSTPATLFIGNRAAVDLLGEGEAMANGDRKSLPFMDIEAVPAYNTTPGRENLHPAGRDNGYILTFGGTRVYVAGDTEDTPEMLALRDMDIVFLPVNQPYTMTEPQAARAVRAINPRIFYPYHLGNGERKTDIAELEKLLDGTGIEVRVRPN